MTACPLLSFPLFFLRHGETAYNAEGRIQGQLDTPLAPRGRDQAASAGRMLGAALARRGWAAADLPFVASPLSRAVETARLARAAMCLEADAFACDPRLMELSFGRWQNLTWPEIRAFDAGGAARRDADIWNARPPEGESYADLAGRVVNWLATLTGPTVAVSHGGVARALDVLLSDAAPETACRAPVAQGRVLVFESGTATWL